MTNLTPDEQQALDNPYDWRYTQAVVQQRDALLVAAQQVINVEPAGNRWDRDAKTLLSVRLSMLRQAVAQCEESENAHAT
jgi:exonuclease I